MRIHEYLRREYLVHVPSQKEADIIDNLAPFTGRIKVVEDAEELRKLDGLISYEEGLRLAWLASQAGPDYAIVELGAYKGKSAAFLASGAGPKGAHVYSIDLWDTPVSNEKRKGRRKKYLNPVVKRWFTKQTEPYKNRITAIQSDTVSVGLNWKGPVGLLWIDASHDYESLHADLIAWLPHLKIGGWLALDDSYSKGVIKALHKDLSHIKQWYRNGKLISCQWSTTDAATVHITYF